MWRKPLAALLACTLLATPALAGGINNPGGGSGGSGTVTSVGTVCGISGGPITTSGTVSGSAVLGNQGSTINTSLGSYSVQGSTASHPDCGTLLAVVGSTAAFAVDLSAASATGFGSGFGFNLENESSVGISLVITTSVVYPPNVSTINIPAGEGLGIQSDGTNYHLNWYSLGLAGEVPNCQDSGGNHLNFNSTTNVISCGTSSSGGSSSTPIMGTAAAVQAQNLNKFYVITGASTAATTEANVLVPAPRSGTITFTSCYTSAAPGSGNSVTMTLRVGSASPGGGTVCTVSNTNTTGTVSGSGVSVSTGNFLDVQVVTSTTLTGSVGTGWGLTYQ